MAQVVAQMALQKPFSGECVSVKGIPRLEPIRRPLRLNVRAVATKSSSGVITAAEKEVTRNRSMVYCLLLLLQAIFYLSILSTRPTGAIYSSASCLLKIGWSRVCHQ